MTIFDHVDSIVEMGKPAALLTIVDKGGSTSKNIGVKMIVTEEGEYRLSAAEQSEVLPSKPLEKSFEETLNRVFEHTSYGREGMQE